MHRFPQHPVIGVGAVIIADDKVLIVKRAHDPRKGEWSLPGGRVKLGESLIDATQREIREETGLEVNVGPLVELFDRVHRHDGLIEYHFVIADYLCTPSGGTLAAGDDAEDVAWVTGDELAAYGVNPRAMAVIEKAFEMYHAQAI